MSQAAASQVPDGIMPDAPPDDVVNHRASRSPIQMPGRSHSLSPRNATPPARTVRSLSVFPNINAYAYEIVAGRRKNSKLLYTTAEQYLYKLHNKSKTVVQYDCYEKTCDAKVYVSVANNLCFKRATNHTHNHNNAAQLLLEMNVSNKVKQGVSNAAMLAANIGATGSGSVRAIYQNCLQRSAFSYM